MNIKEGCNVCSICKLWQVIDRIYSNIQLHFKNDVNASFFIFFEPVSARPYKIGVFGHNWLVGWLVGNVAFSENALRIFLIFCIKLGDSKGRKVTAPDFQKKFLIWRYSRKGLQIRPKSDTLIFFSKTAVTIFWFFAWS